MVVRIYSVVLWVMRPYRLVGGYNCFDGTYHLMPEMPVAVSTKTTCKISLSHNPEIHHMNVGSCSNALYMYSGAARFKCHLDTNNPH
jgi:hypothetical protein